MPLPRYCQLASVIDDSRSAVMTRSTRLPVQVPCASRSAASRKPIRLGTSRATAFGSARSSTESWVTCWTSCSVARARGIRAIERDDVRIEITHPFYPHDARRVAREGHCDFLAVIKLLFEVLDIQNHALIGPFRRAFGLLGLGGHARRAGADPRPLWRRDRCGPRGRGALRRPRAPRRWC